MNIRIIKTQKTKRLAYLATGIVQIADIMVFSIYFAYQSNVLGFTNQQILMLDIPLILTWLAFEFPSGIFADRKGYIPALLISYFCFAVSSLSYFLSMDYTIMFIFSAFMGFAWAMKSGTQDALMIKIFKSETKKFFINRQIIMQICNILTPVIVFALVPLTGFRFFYLANAIMMGATALIFAYIGRSIPKNSTVSGVQKKVNALKVLSEFSKSALLKLNLAAFFLWGLGTVAIDSFFSKITEIGWGIDNVGLAFSLCFAIALFAGGVVKKMKSMDKAYWASFAVSAILTIGIGISADKPIAVILILARSFFFSIHDTISPVIVNKCIRKYRASVLSILAATSLIGSAIAYPIVGYLADRTSIGFTWVISGLLFLLLSRIFYLIQKKIRIVSE